MDEVKHVRTLMTSNEKMDLDKDGKPLMKRSMGGMIKSLLYLTASCPHIMFSVCMFGTFQASPEEYHLIKSIFRRLGGTKIFGYGTLKRKFFL